MKGDGAGMHSDPTNLHANILIIDGDAACGMRIRDSLIAMGYENVLSLIDPYEATEYASTQSPDLVLINLHEQPLNRFELLSMLRAKPISDGCLPVLVMVAAEDHDGRNELLELGAYDLVTKPVNETELEIRMRNALQARKMHLALRQGEIDLEAKVRERTQTLREEQVEILQRLARASEYRDDDTGDHTKRVGAMSAKIAEALGLPADQVELIRLAAPLHDIGKIGIRDSILLKPGKLTESEYIVMRTHAIIGSRILEGNCPLLQMAEIIARTHHEKWDGSGYPSRLAGENIPLPGRIVAVADVFDALTSARSYKGAWPLSRAVEEIKALAGRQFDPAVVEAFLDVVRVDTEVWEAA